MRGFSRPASASIWGQGERMHARGRFPTVIAAALTFASAFGALPAPAGARGSAAVSRCRSEQWRSRLGPLGPLTEHAAHQLRGTQPPVRGS